MKKRSIRFRMTFWFTAALCLMAALIFFALRTAVRLNLRSTVRGYLIGMVEENVSKISYSESRADAGDSALIPLGDGALLIDEDFMEAVNNVRAGLYLAAGEVVFEKAKREKDDGRWIYEVEFFVEGVSEYEYEIDAATGEILEEDVEDWDGDD